MLEIIISKEEINPIKKVLIPIQSWLISPSRSSPWTPSVLFSDHSLDVPLWPPVLELHLWLREQISTWSDPAFVFCDCSGHVSRAGSSSYDSETCTTRNSSSCFHHLIVAGPKVGRGQLHRCSPQILSLMILFSSFTNLLSQAGLWGGAGSAVTGSREKIIQKTFEWLYLKMWPELV